MRKSSWGMEARSAPGARAVVFVAMLVDDGDPLGIRKEDAHD
jgi:hypothetical protein